MTKKELKAKVIAIYKKAFRTEDEPTALDIAKLSNLMAQVMCHPEAEQELGKELCDLIKRNTIVKKRDVEVKITNILNEIGWYDKEEDYRKYELCSFKENIG